MVNEPYENKHSGIGDDRSQLGIIRNRKAGLQWLKKTGWQTSRASFYRHITQGKLAVSTAGTIGLADLELYAVSYLQKAEPPPDHRVVSAIHEMERTARIELLRVRAEKLKFEHDLTKNKYLLRDDVHTAFAVRLGILETTLKNMYRTNAESWLLACNADPAAAGILFGLMEKELDELLEYLGNLEELRVVVKKRPINEN